MAVLAIALLAAGPAAPVPAGGPSAGPSAGAEAPRHDLLAVAQEIRLGMSLAEVMRHLAAQGLFLEGEPAHLPGGRTRLLLAVPPGDDCLPRGAPLLCANLRVVFRDDPAQGPGVVRVEAFQPLGTPLPLAEALRRLGPPAGLAPEVLEGSERVRGRPLAVWRQRWQEGDGPVVDILATQAEAPAARPAGDWVAGLGLARREGVRREGGGFASARHGGR